MDKYTKHIASPEWARIRDERVRLDQGKCTRCGRSDLRLEVHHRTYERLGDERIEDLETLCVLCHDKETDESRRRKHERRWSDFGCSTRSSEKKVICGSPLLW